MLIREGRTFINLVAWPIVNILKFTNDIGRYDGPPCGPFLISMVYRGYCIVHHMAAHQRSQFCASFQKMSTGISLPDIKLSIHHLL